MPSLYELPQIAELFLVGSLHGPHLRRQSILTRWKALRSIVTCEMARSLAFNCASSRISEITRAPSFIATWLAASRRARLVAACCALSVSLREVSCSWAHVLAAFSDAKV